MSLQHISVLFVCFAVCIDLAEGGLPLKQTDCELHVNVYRDKGPYDRDFWKSYRKDGVAVGAIIKEPEMVNLRFREQLTKGERFVGTLLTVPGVLKNVPIAADPITDKDEHLYEFLIHREHLDGVTLRVQSVGKGKEGGDLLRWRTFILKTKPTKAVDSGTE